ncbi:unnamed protein product [Somion occarium]|uniref:Uncharacterized protein n=1 Tax=Somion occarium TaxID=3059160 RepID=A0ABP1E2T2_9APHY
MSTTIERALTSLVRAQQPITVVNVLSAYLQIAGFATEPSAASEDAILAFEHALDKHPAPPPMRTTRNGKIVPSSNVPATGRRKYSADVARLREEYWKDKLGKSAKLKCTCADCGGFVGYVENGHVVDDHSSQKKRVVKKRKTKKRVVKRVHESETTWDPYAPSTSTFVL